MGRQCPGVLPSEAPGMGEAVRFHEYFGIQLLPENSLSGTT